MDTNSTDTEPYDEFLDAVETLRDDNATVRVSAHTSSVSAEAWTDPAETGTPANSETDAD
ncbi:hypothetical protein [Streptomyces sp. NPDC093109]|uniref:hypothetical protein n=1 Tax=Streptomyces sp. NPDC093109 TaxID=3154977 RepID=UPI00344CA6F7